MKDSSKDSSSSPFSRLRIEKLNRLSELFAKTMNEMHGMQHSERFWKLILLPYYSAVLSSNDVIKKQQDWSFNPPLEVYSNTVFPNKQSRRYGFLRYSLKMIASTFLNLKGHLKNILGMESVYIGFENILAVQENQKLQAIYPYFSLKRVNRALRSSKIFYTAEFPEEFMQNVIANLPMMFVEYFESLYARIEVSNPKSKIFHVLSFENVFSRIIVAKYISHGARLFYYQHGGYYGEYEFHNAHFHESSISDRFYTWGWKLLNNDVPGVALKCETFKFNYLKLRRDWKIDILLVYPAMSGQIRLKYTAMTAILDADLDWKYKSLCVRPRPTNRLIRREVFVFKRPGKVQVDFGYKPIVNLIVKSRLVVHFNYPSTTMLECLYVDHPSVAILDNYIPSVIVEKYYSFFISKGIFHYGMESLVKHLNSVDIEIWWSQIICDETYLNFKNEFLRSPIIPLKD